MTVNMPVEAINERCLKCPELDIDITTIENYGTNDEDKRVIEVKSYENRMRCKHVDRCRAVLYHEEMGKKEAPKKKAPAKKTASPRKKQASK